MANLYLVLDDNGRVRGCQTTKGTIDDSRYVLVDEKTYNEFARLGAYEKMEFDGNKFITHADSRPEYKITAPDLKKAGEPITIELEAVKVDISRGVKDEVKVMEYECPDGRIGLVRASFRDGVATCTITPDKSGYYRFVGSNEYKPEEVKTIAVYEE